jgi:mycothiol synthase
VHHLDVRSSLDDDHRREVTRLLDAAAEADGAPSLDDHMRLDLAGGGGPGFAAITSRVSAGDLAAYGQVSRGHHTALVDVVVHPAHRHDTENLASEVLDAARRTVTADGGRHVHWWVTSPTDAHQRIAASVGLHPGRTLMQMRCELPIEPARRGTAVVTRAFVVGEDEDAWLAVNNRAFAEHPEQGGWTRATLQLREAEPWFDARAFRLHEVDDRLAAFCWTKRHDRPELMGEIYVIAVDPDFAGRGLGRSLTVAGLDAIAAQGIATAMLHVDADNAPAMHLYRSLGFDVHHVKQAFVSDGS